MDFSLVGLVPEYFLGLLFWADQHVFPFFFLWSFERRYCCGAQAGFEPLNLPQLLKCWDCKACTPKSGFFP